VVGTTLVGWRGTREELWNRAEETERHPRAVTAREIQLALPAELSTANRWALAVEYAHWLRARLGVAVDVAVHRPGHGGDLRNHHAHLLLTSRAVDEVGVFGVKTRVLDQRRTGCGEVERMRAAWAELLNAALAEAGLPGRVDHRSYLRQSLDREPEHVGRAALAVEARGTPTERGDERRSRQARNARRERQSAASRRAGGAAGESRPGAPPVVAAATLTGRRPSR
jgi:hypothetical protein